MNQTTFLGLKLPEPSDYYDVEGQTNYNSNKIDEYAAALTGDGGIIAQIQSAIAALSTGVCLKGAVNYYTDLPANPSEGDAYTVRYSGTSGATASGIEYCWAKYDNVLQWIPIGVDPSVFAKAADLTAETTARTTADTKHNAALVELVDGGAKNRMPVASGSNTEQSNTWFSAPISLPAGDYVVFFEDFYSSNTDNPRQGRIAFLDGTASQNPTASYKYVDYDNTGHATNAAVEVTINNNDTATIRFYPAQTYVASTGDTVSFTNCMVCSKAAWEISHKFVPYCPTMPELYALIQAQT